MAAGRYPKPTSWGRRLITPQHAQQVRQLLGTMLAVATLAVSASLALKPDVVQRFNHMGYVGGLIVNALASGTIALPMPGVTVTLAMAPTLNARGLAVFAGLGCAIGETVGFLLGVGIYAVLRDRYRLQFGRLRAWWRRFGIPVVFVAAVAPTPLFDIAGILAGTARMRYWAFFTTTALGKGLKYYVLFSLFIGLPTGLLGSFAAAPAPTPLPSKPGAVQSDAHHSSHTYPIIQNTLAQFGDLEYHGSPLAFHLGVGTDPASVAITRASPGGPQPTAHRCFS